MTNVAAADINVAAVMSREENQSAVEQLKAAMEANPAVNQMLEAAQSVEEMYAAVKEYISLRLEDFQVLFEKTVEFFKGPKVQLEDDMMECVAGGWSLSGFWNKYKRAICATVVVAGVAAIGAAAGVVVGVTAAMLAGGSLVTGGAIGGAIGGVIGAVGGGVAFTAAEKRNGRY